MVASDKTGSPSILRNTHRGPVAGVDDTARSGTLYWLGVPYAMPPVGALRWRAPREPDAWSSPRPCTAFGCACVQYGTIFGPGANNAYDTTIADTFNQVVGSEDCLYLNIWRPATGENDLPVIVFLHGGSNVAGYTADPIYNGANLARAANVVVVTVNYRLGVFGWLSLPQLKTGIAEEDSGNFGTLDTIHALRWVSRNIGEFGGSARNVTLMGHSAGAINAWVLTVAAPTRRAELFHRLVALSGGMSLASNLPPGSMPCLNPTPYCAAQGQALLNALLIADGIAKDDESAAAWAAARTSAQVAEYLRALSPAAILRALLAKLVPVGLGASAPVPDGTVLPADPIGMLAAGEYARVPVLAGNTREEAKLFARLLALSPALGGVPGIKVSEFERFLMAHRFDPDSATSLSASSLISEQYLPVDAPQTGYNARTALLSQIFFFANRDNVLNALKARQANVWCYRFDWAREPAPWNEVLGSAHFVDMPFVFGNFGPSVLSNLIGGKANALGRSALSEAMMASIGAFARTGDPNNASLGITWPMWPGVLVFDAGLADKAISVQ